MILKLAPGKPIIANYYWYISSSLVKSILVPVLGK